MLYTMVFTILILLYAGFIGFDSYGMYKFLRVWVCFVSAFIAWQYYTECKNQLISFIFIVLAVLFNPIFKIHLHRNDWEIIDIAVALIYIIFTLYLYKNKGTENMSKGSNHERT